MAFGPLDIQMSKDDLGFTYLPKTLKQAKILKHSQRIEQLQVLVLTWDLILEVVGNNYVEYDNHEFNRLALQLKTYMFHPSVTIIRNLGAVVFDDYPKLKKSVFKHCGHLYQFAALLDGGSYYLPLNYYLSLRQEDLERARHEGTLSNVGCFQKYIVSVKKHLCEDLEAKCFPKPIVIIIQNYID